MVTDRIIEQMQQGVIPWCRPWKDKAINRAGAVSYITRKPYSLINQFLLGKPGEWLTFRQVKERGGNIRKGARSRFVVFFDFVPPKGMRLKEMTQEEKDTLLIPILKYYNVFHISDCEGVESRYEETEAPADPIEPVTAAEEVIRSYLAHEPGLRLVNDRVSKVAYYNAEKDLAQVPMMDQYENVEEYYGRVFHVLVSSTQLEGRCNRVKGTATYGSEEYSRERLVAEMGSAMLCSCTDLEMEKSFRNSVAYISNWIDAFRGDVKMVVWAASRAEKAADYILGNK